MTFYHRVVAATMPMSDKCSVSEGLPPWVWRRSKIIGRKRQRKKSEFPSACARNKADRTRSLGPTMQNVLREILHYRAITLSWFIKSDKSRYERAIYHGAATTAVIADTLCFGCCVGVEWVVC